MNRAEDVFHREARTKKVGLRGKRNEKQVMHPPIGENSRKISVTMTMVWFSIVRRHEK